jgi:hypothetical protein
VPASPPPVNPPPVPAAPVNPSAPPAPAAPAAPVAQAPPKPAPVETPPPQAPPAPKQVRNDFYGNEARNLCINLLSGDEARIKDAKEHLLGINIVYLIMYYKDQYAGKPGYNPEGILEIICNDKNDKNWAFEAFRFALDNVNKLLKDPEKDYIRSYADKAAAHVCAAQNSKNYIAELNKAAEIMYEGLVPKYETDVPNS